MAKFERDVITILAGHFQQPIADMVEKLCACKVNADDPSTPLYAETSYAVSLVALLVMMFESYVSRMRHFDKSATNRNDTLKYVEHVFRSRRAVLRLMEVYVLRDAIAHNHVLEYVQRGRAENLPRETEFKIDRSWQTKNAKYTDRVLLRTRKRPITKLLRLNVVPTRIGRNDVRLVFIEIRRLLDRLHSTGKSDLSVKHDHVRFTSIRSGKPVTHRSFLFWQLPDEF